jgi:hypothetical protein
MADWKQITARIRRARTGKDPATQLSNLYQKTRDGMVAYELARHFETSGQNGEAVKWYSTAAERFRRADWKTKAQEALTRLGAEPQIQTNLSDSLGAQETLQLTSTPTPTAEPTLPFEESPAEFQTATTAEEATSLRAVPSSTTAGGVSRRRRGRRGGRNRRKGAAETANAVTPAPREPQVPALRRQSPPVSADEAGEPRFGTVAETFSLPTDAPAELGAAARGRHGDPGLSSRLSLLEMQFRRLLSCAPVKLDEADRAPVGPGVFLLTDSDMTSHYYVEACQTLRIAVANLLRGGSSRRGGDSIKPRLAEHLGIAETRVAKYLGEHCVVRWLQLDEGASYFAHFLIAILRPSLND